MSRITRQQFLQKFANKEMDVQDVDMQTRNEMWRAGEATVWALRQSDVNGDGKISGAEEVNKLFDYVDSFDRNGSRASVDTRRADGSLTNPGKLYNILSLQFAEADGTTDLPTGNDIPVPTPRPDVPGDTNDGQTTTPVTPQPGVTPTTGVEQPTETAKPSLGELFAQGGADSIDSKMSGHLKSLEETGVGLYYGDHSSMNKMSHSEIQSWIDDKAIAGTQPPSASELKESSCIGWAMENVAEAYKVAGKGDRWREIQSIVRRDGMRGTTLAQELQKDGWESVYWNGDTSNTSHNGEHSYSAAMVKRGKPYYGIDIDHQVLNYEKGDMSGIDQLKEVPFFFGLARGGSHTFVGRDGNVNEFHWSHMPDSDIAIEETPLKDWGWGSGVIMVPPGSWPTE